MGKSKRIRKRGKVENPTGLPSVRDIEEEESELGEPTSRHETAISTVIEQARPVVPSPDWLPSETGVPHHLQLFEPGSVNHVCVLSHHLQLFEPGSVNHVCVLSQLQSPDVDFKLYALQTLATVFTSPQPVEEVIRHRVVKMAAPLLVDDNPVVRNASAGALR
uniref:(California timema) hypothetical protein n=1 Tax=Timema californicum TaxID=61474 RepID=A0A7R9PFF0_TIMCA|nr:unnamed protein product [Timema californicum]